MQEGTAEFKKEGRKYWLNKRRRNALPVGSTSFWQWPTSKQEGTALLRRLYFNERYFFIIKFLNDLTTKVEYNICVTLEL